MKIITLKADGRLEHVWIPGVHQQIPAAAITVSDADAELLLNNRDSKRYKPATSSVEDYVKPFDFYASLSVKMRQVASGFKAAMSIITGSYTEEDIASFPTQEAEANAWQADNAAATPFIDGLLANRPGIDKATLVGRILQNSASYKSVAGPLIGKKQAYEDQLYALEAQHLDPNLPDVTQADLDSIVVSFA